MQQAQTFSYFDGTAAEWRMKAEGRVEKVNVIAQRNLPPDAAGRHDTAPEERKLLPFSSSFVLAARKM